VKTDLNLWDAAMSLVAIHSRRIAAFIVALFAALFSPGVSRVLGVSALEVIPVDDNQAATLAVAAPVKPTETVGGIVDGLLKARPNGADVKIAVLKPGRKGLGARVRMFPVGAGDGVLFDGGEVLGVITRDLDPEIPAAKQQSTAHTMAVEAGKEADPVVVAILSRLEATKPRRALGALINALADAFETLDSSGEMGNIAFSQAGDGTITVLRGAPLGTGAGKLADVSQIDSDVEDAALPSNW
jgi:hypothetical protein